MIAVIGIVVILAIIVGAYYLIGGNKGTAGNSTTTNQPATVNQTTTTNASAISQMYSNATCGPGKNCISESEVDSLIGSGGGYRALYTNKSSVIQSEFPGKGITSMYAVTDQNGATGVLSEAVFQSTKAQSLYFTLLSAYSSKYTIINGTLNGMTYVYNVTSSATASMILLTGWKHNATAYAVVESNKTIDPATLAKIVAGDLP